MDSARSEHNEFGTSRICGNSNVRNLLSLATPWGNQIVEGRTKISCLFDCCVSNSVVLNDDDGG